MGDKAEIEKRINELKGILGKDAGKVHSDISRAFQGLQDEWDAVKSELEDKNKH